MPAAAPIHQEILEPRALRIVGEIDLPVARAEVEHARVVHEILKANPTLDRGLRQVFEEIRRQLDVALPAIQLENAVGRWRNGLRVER
jgi:hypothetical protein